MNLNLFSSRWMALGLTSLIAVGCGGPEQLTQEELLSLEQGIELEADADVISQEPTTTSTRHRLIVPDGNLGVLQHACLDGSGLLKWQCADASNTNDGRGLNVACSSQVGTNDTRVDDNYCGYDGECVSFVKGVTHNNTTTSGWGKGANVFTGLAAGTVIATFSGSSYYGHTAVFLKYIKDGSGNVTGIRVADENWTPSKVMKHNLYKSGSGTSDANNYYAVTVP
jgi:hypothetical protein